MKDVFSFLIVFFLGFCLGNFIEWKKWYYKPKAIDVYRGNTSLEITYRDSVAIDSIVVFKSKYNENIKD